MQSCRAPECWAIAIVPANRASLEEKNKLREIRESKIENVPGSLNLQAIFLKFSAATLSQREFAPQGLLCAYASTCRTDPSTQQNRLPASNTAVLLVNSCLCNNIVIINKLQIQ